MTALAGDRNLSTPTRQPPAAAEIVVKTIVTHTVTYFVAGVLAYSLLDYPRLISGSTLGVLMRPLRDPMIVAGPLFQPIRGLLFGVMFCLLRQTFFGRRDGWFLMWAVLVVVGIVGPFGAPPGSLEGLIYTTVPVSVQLTFLPEVLAQSLALSWLLVSWVKRPERRWLNWVMGVAFVITMLLPTLGLLTMTR